MGGEFLLKLNIGQSPIAYKYCEGKLQRTLERELKVPEIGNGEGFERAAPSVCSTVGFCDNSGRSRDIRSGLLVALWLLAIIQAWWSGWVRLRQDCPQIGVRAPSPDCVSGLSLWVIAMAALSPQGVNSEPQGAGWGCCLWL